MSLTNNQPGYYVQPVLTSLATTIPTTINSGPSQWKVLERKADGTTRLVGHPFGCTKDEARTMVTALNARFYPEQISDLAAHIQQMVTDLDTALERNTPLANSQLEEWITVLTATLGQRDTEGQLAELRTIVTRLLTTSTRYPDHQRVPCQIVDRTILQELQTALVIVDVEL